MTKSTLASAALALCAPMLAQGFITSPPGGLPDEGHHYSRAFGWYANAHYQLADDMLTGGGSHTLTQIAFRLDYRRHTSSTAMGRTWTKITLDISETTNFSGFSRTFATNITTTPTRVFDGKGSWPSMIGFPKNRPDDWGSVNGMLRFPFRKPWAYTAKNAILMDYVFRGGSLSNQAPWSGGDRADYWLDTDHLFTTLKVATQQPLPLQAVRCRDSAITALPGAAALTYAKATAHGPVVATLTLRNKLQLEHYSYFTAPNAPVLHAIGLGGFNAGVNIGANCNLLYVDFKKPAALLSLGPTNSGGASGRMGWLVPWNKAFAGLELYIQAAWADSRTKALSLAGAIKLTLPNRLPPAGPPRYRSIDSFVLHYLAALSIVKTGPLPFTQYMTK